jgi:hypothetical protein
VPLFLILLLPHAEAQLVIFPRGAISFTDLIAPTVFPEPALLALLGARLIVHI